MELSGLDDHLPVADPRKFRLSTPEHRVDFVRRAAHPVGHSRWVLYTDPVGVVEKSDESWLIVVTGWAGAGKSTMADLVAQELGATVASSDWLMSGLRAIPDVWEAVERPVERQRRTGWNLLGRVAEQQLRRGSSCVLDLVAREEIRIEWEELAQRYGARFGVVECVCSDLVVHRSRIEGRDRDIPGWYEMTWDRVAAGRDRYTPLAEPKLVLDAVSDLDANFVETKAWLRDL